MGLLSVTVGLPAAMAGTGAFALFAAAVLVAVRRR
jgi:MYXO-CTERM domain-containing protein